MTPPIEAIYRSESQRVLATLIRLLGDFDLAEEALHEAFFVAVERRQARFTPLLQAQADASEAADCSDEDVEDDRLRLVFTCCHPALAADAQAVLALREICDLTTEEIARASPQVAACQCVRHAASPGLDSCYGP